MKSAATVPSSGAKRKLKKATKNKDYSSLAEQEHEEYVQQKKKTGKPIMRHWLTNKLRRLSYQWPPRKEAIRNARVERGIYLCAICAGKFRPKEIQLDHKIPVVDEEMGFVDWNTYIDRLFCNEENFQVLCKPCHGAKTFLEQEIRKQVKKERIEKEESDI